MVAKNQDTFSFEWKSSGHHLVFFVSSIIDWGSFFFLLSDSINDSTPLHWLVVATVVGHPVILLQNFIGQYTRRGCLFVGELLPVAQGVGYTILMLTFFEFVILFSYASMVVEYLLMAVINLSPPWMTCFKVFYNLFPNCFSVSDLDLCPTASVSSKPCFEPGTRTLAPIIFKLFIFGKLQLPKENSDWDITDFHNSFVRHTTHGFIIYVLLLTASMRQLKGIDLVLRVGLLLSFVAFIQTTVVITIQVPTSNAVFSLFTRITSESVMDLMAWKSALKTVIRGMMLAQAHNFLFGSFIPASDPAPNRGTQLTATYFVLTIICAISSCLYVEYIKYKMNMSMEMLGLQKSEENFVFILAPMVLGSQASAHGFTIVYFLILAVTSFNSLAAKVVVIEKSISLFFNIQEFYFHVRFAVCTVGALCTYGVVLVNNEMELRLMGHEVYIYSVSVVVMQLVIICLYGLQRMWDDMEFFAHFRVSAFTQFCCLLTPVICILDIWLETLIQPLQPTHWKIRIITMVSLSFPNIICLVYKVAILSKKKNLIGILRPTDDYGPPDVECRIFRILYNPRTLARYKRQVETCRHDCLLKSEAFRLAIEDEIQLLEKFVTELEANPTDRVSCAKIISQLKTHQVLLNKRLKHC